MKRTISERERYMKEKGLSVIIDDKLYIKWLESLCTSQAEELETTRQSPKAMNLTTNEAMQQFKDLWAEFRDGEAYTKDIYATFRTGFIKGVRFSERLEQSPKAMIYCHEFSQKDLCKIAVSNYVNKRGGLSIDEIRLFRDGFNDCYSRLEVCKSEQEG